MATNEGRKRAQTDAPAKGKRTKVRALRTGYYNEQRYREGDVFVFTGEQLPSWVEPVAAATAEKVTTGQEAINTELDNLRSERVGAAGDDVL